jgi:hypothetical protein
VYEVARAEGSDTNPYARLHFAPTVSGQYLIVLRAREESAPGTIDLKLNGKPWQEAVAVGGHRVRLTNVRTSERIETVRVPMGGGSRHVVYELSVDGVIRRRITSGGIGGGVAFTPKTGTGLLLLGIRAPGTAGLVRLVRNDARLSTHDPDEDDLGTELETALGTCSTSTGSATGRIPQWRYKILRHRGQQMCQRTAPDANAAEACLEEFLEYLDAHVSRSFQCNLAADPRDTDGDGISDRWEVLGRRFDQDDQLLPLWGADPRHKDLFVEVDFMLREQGETAMTMSPDFAREFGSYYQDEVRPTAPLRRLFRATTLVNPDGIPGVDVHLDTGVEPTTPEDSTLFGDWGGYTAVPPVQVGNNFSGADYKTAWMNYMNASRIGIFRYALPYSSGAGSTPVNSFAWASGLDNAPIFTHESGHAMGLGHAGGFGAGGPLDVNCKPNYPSVMNYAYDDESAGFSDGVGGGVLNNAAAVEWKAVNPGDPAFMDLLQDVFGYWVDRGNGHVDWNRDGRIATAGRESKAYANLAPGESCEYTRAKEVIIPAAASVQTPALGRLQGRLYAFYSILGLLRYTHTSLPINCPIDNDSACIDWSDWSNALLNAGGGVDVAPLAGFGSAPGLLVVTIDNDGVLWESRLTLTVNGGEAFTPPVRIPNSSIAAGEPALAQVGACANILVYKDTTHTIRYRSLTCAGGWGPEKVATTPNNLPIVTWKFASPGVERAYLPHDPGVPRIYGAIPDQNGRMALFGHNATTDRWEPVSVFDSIPNQQVEGRPAMAWVPFSNSSDFPGRFYLVFVRHHSSASVPFKNKERTVRMLMSYVRVTASPSGTLVRQEFVGLNSPFDNIWHKAFGIDLLFDAAAGSNLISIESRSSDASSVFATVRLRPYADGIIDNDYSNANDWQTIRLGLCRNVVNPTKQVSDPIICP